MFINNKRAVSPLIATILLIAFAVALGAVVMNIPQDSDDGQNLPTQKGCDSVALSILKTGSNEFLCYNIEQKQLLLTLINEPKGSQSIIILRFRQLVKRMCKQWPSVSQEALALLRTSTPSP